MEKDGPAFAKRDPNRSHRNPNRGYNHENRRQEEDPEKPSFEGPGRHNLHQGSKDSRGRAVEERAFAAFFT
jgi:hypothetical protein